MTRDLRVRYSRSVLGYLWTILDPLLMSLIYFLVFVYIFKRGDLGHEPYFLFLVVGLLSWQWFSGVAHRHLAGPDLGGQARPLDQPAPRDLGAARGASARASSTCCRCRCWSLSCSSTSSAAKPHLNGWLVLFPLGIVVQVVASWSVSA